MLPFSPVPVIVMVYVPRGVVVAVFMVRVNVVVGVTGLLLKV